MSDPYSLLAIILTFLIAGGVKGVIGLGLPTVSLAVFAVLFDLQAAMALLIVPSFVTNVWQACVGGHAIILVRRLWFFFLSATLFIGVGALALTRVQPEWLSILLGVLLVIYAATALAGFRPQSSTALERRWGPVLGGINGLLTGMTGSFVVPGVLYLQALGLDRNALIQAMGMLFTLSTLALGIALQSHQLLSAELAKASLIGLLPALIGMVLGQKVRQAFSEAQFRTVFFVALILMGGYIIASSLYGIQAYY